MKDTITIHKRLKKYNSLRLQREYTARKVITWRQNMGRNINNITTILKVNYYNLFERNNEDTWGYSPFLWTTNLCPSHLEEDAELLNIIMGNNLVQFVWNLY